MNWLFFKKLRPSSDEANKVSGPIRSSEKRTLSLVPLSIHPDPKYYVESSKNPYSRIRRVIDVSDGGVLGITGERGAGKSVLLNKIIDDYSDEFLTVNLAAPISTSREMEFFTMLFRHLTQRVITELRKRAKNKLDDLNRLGQEAIGKDRRRQVMIMLLLTGAIGIAYLSFYRSFVVSTRIQEAQYRVQYIQTQLAILTNKYDEEKQHLVEQTEEIKAKAQTDMSVLKRHQSLAKRMGGSLNTRRLEESQIKEQEISKAAAEEERSIETHIAMLDQDLEREKRDAQQEQAQLQADITDLQTQKNTLMGNQVGVFVTGLSTLLVLGTAFYLVTSVKPLGSRLKRQERGLLVYSERLAQRLDYELTRTSEHSFDIAALTWLKGSSKSSNQEKARGLSLPELTASYIEFVSIVLKIFPGKLLICIDELDKVTDLEQVRFILREIKGAMYVKGTFYVLSISNDALRSFEGRMGDQRDIFESTFDDVFAVRALEIDVCLDILRKRLNGVDDIDHQTLVTSESLATIAVFSGGNARDLVRGFRECALSAADRSFPGAEATWEILFSRRLEAISDRARAAGGTSALRKLIIPRLDGLMSPNAGKGRDIEHLAECRRDLNKLIHTLGTVEPNQAEERSTAQRFLRYAIELEILVQTKDKVSLVPWSEHARSDAILLMGAYQILPFSTSDAELALDGLIDPDRTSVEVISQIPPPPVPIIGEPLSDRHAPVTVKG